MCNCGCKKPLEIEIWSSHTRNGEFNEAISMALGFAQEQFPRSNVEVRYVASKRVSHSSTIHKFTAHEVE